MAKVQITRAQTPTSTGTQDITISGFGTVKGAIVICGQGLTDGTEKEDALISIGFTDGTNYGSSVGAATDSNATSVGRRAFDSTDELVQIYDGTSVDAQAELSTFITDGIRLNWTSADSDQRLMTIILIGGSDVSCAMGGKKFNANVGNTDSITGLSFQPTAVFMAHQGTSTDNYSNTHPGSCFGVAVDEGSSVISQICWGSGNQDSLSTSNVDGSCYNNRVMTQHYPSSNWEAELTAFNTDGFTLTARSAAIGDWAIYLAVDFGAASLKTGSYSSPTATGSDSISSIGFTPGFAMLGMGMLSSYNTHSTSATGGVMSIGLMDGTNEYCENYHFEDGVTTTNCGSTNDDKAVYVTDDAGTLMYQAGFTSFGSGTITLNYTTEADSASRSWVYFAVEEESSGTEVLPGVGAVTFTGYAPTIATPRNIQPGAGAVTFTGYAATVFASDNQEVQPDTGSVTFTGFAPTIELPVNVLPDVGAVTYTGYVPTVATGANIEVLPDVGVITYAGFAPTIELPVNVQPDVGAVTYTGFFPSVTTGDNIEILPDVGAVTFTGYEPTIAAGANIEVLPDVGTVTFTGYSPVIFASANVEILPGVGVAAFTGFSPAISTTANINVFPGTGSAIFTGYAPAINLTQHVSVYPGYGEITFVGHQPFISEYSDVPFPIQRLITIFDIEERYKAVFIRQKRYSGEVIYQQRYKTVSY